MPVMKNSKRDEPGFFAALWTVLRWLCGFKSTD
jgi:hypothetical protein